MERTMRTRQLGQVTGVDVETIRRCLARARLECMRAPGRQLAALRGQCGASHAARACGILHDLVAGAHGESCACHTEAARSPVTPPPRFRRGKA